MLDGKASEAERAKCEAALEEQGCSLMALKFIHSLEAMQRAHTQPSAVQPSHTGSLFSFAGKTLQSGASLWSKSVKALTPTYGDMPTTRIVDSIITGNNPELTQDYLTFDPKRSRSATAARAAAARAEQTVVFMVGG